MGGLGTQDKGLYQPTALKDWELTKGVEGRFQWEALSMEGKGDFGEVLVEDELGEVEKMLLAGEREEVIAEVEKGGFGLNGVN